MALALYRKYRPRTFAEVIGQEHVTEPLSQALRSGRLHHAYLFSGPRGCGKTSSARILARSLNCEQGPTPEPCGVCASCKSLANDGAGSIDVIEIDAASHGGVDDARDLREKAFFAPAASRYKIYVIDEAHMVSPAGFNALLKLVEEPPDYVKFIFATTEPEKVLGTIRSRTHHYPFRLIPPAVLRPYLQQLTEAEGVHVDPAVLPLVVRAGGGSARDTLSVLDQLISGAGPEGVSYPRAVSLLGVTDVALIDEMCDALAASDGSAAYHTIDRVAEAGHDARRFASDLLERFRDLIVLQQVPDAVAKGLIDGPADQLEQMGAQATRLGPATLSRCADIVHNGLVEMRGTTAPRLLLELITARMLLPGADDANNALLQRLERMERRLTLTTDEVRPQPGSPERSPAPAAPAAGDGGGGISAARAAAAAAGRRAPAAGATTGSAAPVSAPAGNAAGVGPEGSVGAGAAAPVSSWPGSAAPVSSVPGAASPVSGAADSGPPWSTSPTSAPSPTPTSGGPVSPTSGSAGRGPAVSPASGAVAPGATAPLSAAPAYGVPGATAPASAAPGYAVPGATAPGATPPVSAGATAPASAGAAAPASAPPAAVPAAPVSAAPASASASGPVSGGSAGPVSGGVSGGPASAVPDSAGPASGGPAGRPTEPPGLMPDAPEEPGFAPVAEVPGRLTAASIREVWPEIMTVVSRKSKKIAALAQGATVRDLEGQTVVLTFRFPAHAKMVAAEPTLISDALYEALGGRWQIRCDVAGESGPSPGSGGSAPRGPRGGPSGPAQRSPQVQASPPQAQSGASRQDAGRIAAGAGGAPSRQREAAPRASVAVDGDDWPAPARPGGLATAVATQVAEVDAEDNEWPEPAMPGGAMPGGAMPGGASAGGVSPGGRADESAGQGFGDPSVGQSSPAGDDLSGPGGGRGFGGGSADPGTTADRPGSRNGPPAAASARPAGGGRAASSGLAAARAAAAGAGRGANAAPPTQPGAWSDGSPTEEAPYDPEYDGPPHPGGGHPGGGHPGGDRPGGGHPGGGQPSGGYSTGGGHPGAGGSAFEGFDPGDEPLDDVIDEKTARQSSEQQAVQLLRDALGAEKISES